MLRTLVYIIMSAIITGNSGFVAVAKTVQLSATPSGGSWTSSNTAVATVDASTGIVTGVAQGGAVITYTSGPNTATVPVNVLPMAYTNGLDVSRLLPVLIGRKGWRQPTNSSFTPVLNSVNTSCSSFRYYERDQPACSPIKLLAAQEDPGITSDAFNQYLTDLQVGVVMESLNAVFRQNSVVEEPKIIFEKSFRTSYRPIPNASKFCGWQLAVCDGDYTTKVDSISLTASAPCTVTIFLYNDLRQAPLWSRNITVTVPNDQTIINIDDLYLTRQDDSHKGGVFFFGYYQDQIQAQGAQGVDVYLNWWEAPKTWRYQAFEASSSYNSGAPANSTFVRDNYFSNYRTYGLGVELTTFFNYTNTICRQAHEFDNLMGLMMSQRCITEIMQSTQASGKMRISQPELQDLYNHLNGMPFYRAGEQVGTNYRTGLKYKIEQEVKRVQDTFLPPDEPIHSIPPVNDYSSQLPPWGYMV